jgi:ubiquinone/menaquinone biosynthesis C-methylase UbiE
MEKELAKKIIQDTEKGYNLISEKFSQTRSHLWKDLEFIGSYCKKGDKVLDLVMVVF